MDNLEIIRSLKKDLPQTKAIIGYGSGVFKQAGYTKEDKPDKDVILVVDDFKDFLMEDYKQNPNHFSEDFNIHNLQSKKEKTNFYSNMGCLKFYHDDIHFKAMIISKSCLMHDLKTWQYFGMAGRLTKPIIYENLDKDLEKAIEKNRYNILITALLLNKPGEIKSEDLYNTISKITYMYDFRTILPGEKKTKSIDIVNGSKKFFDEVYKNNEYIYSEGDIIYNPYPIELIDLLPTNLKNNIYSDLKIKDVKELSLKDKNKIQKSILNYFKHTNFPNSISLALASATTLGKKETAKHAVQKFKKYLKK